MEHMEKKYLKIIFLKIKIIKKSNTKQIEWYWKLLSIYYTEEIKLGHL